MAMLKDFRKSSKGGIPKRWLDRHPHTHIALDDAAEQGTLLCNMLAENLGNAQYPATSLTRPQELERIIRADPRLMQLLHVAREVGLPQWRVVAGCIYQTVWNSLTGRPPGTGITDYDLIYFDGADLSQEMEAAIENRIRNKLPPLSVPVEVCNQARVHLWFEDYFGMVYPPLSSADEAITRYASATHAVGVRLMHNDHLEIFAPFGLDDIFEMVIRPNYALPNKATHQKKAVRAQAIWPQLRIIPWD